MSQHKRSIIIFIALAVLIVPASIVTAQGPKPSDARAPKVSAGTAFTYQGQLKNNGALVTQSCNFQFSLFDAASSGNQIGATQTKSNVSVSNGLFTTSIDFGANAFTGDTRFLQIAVACPSGSSYVPMGSRQALTPAPYALSLVPGAIISGTGTLGMQLNIPNGNAIAAYGQANGYATIYGNDASLTGGYGVYGDSTKGTGVFGNSAQSFGVRGESSNNAGAGVMGVGKCINVGGNCIASSNNVPGVVGKAEANGVGVYGSSVSGTGVGGQSTSGIGVHGTSTSWVGVWGQSVTSSGVNGSSTDWVGVWGESVNSSGVHGKSTNWYGVYGSGAPGKSSVFGENQNANSIGVQGKADAAGSVGVWGESTNNTGVYGLSTNGTGVWGKSTAGYAVFAEGNVAQTVNSNGLVKAMVSVDPSLPAGQQIVRCFNSQTSASVATTIPCGFTATGLELGRWQLDFGFDTSQRFATITTQGLYGGCRGSGNCAIVGEIYYYTSTGLEIFTKYADTGNKTNTPFMLILY